MVISHPFPSPRKAQLFPLPRWASISYFPFNGTGTEISSLIQGPSVLNELPLTCTALLTYTVTPSLPGWGPRRRSRRRRKSFSCLRQSWQIYELVFFGTASGTTLQQTRTNVIRSRKHNSDFRVKMQSHRGKGRREKRKRETSKWEFEITKPQDSTSPFSWPFFPLQAH